MSKNFTLVMKGYRTALHGGVQMTQNTAGLLAKLGVEAALAPLAAADAEAQAAGVAMLGEILGLFAEPAKYRLFATQSVLQRVALCVEKTRAKELLPKLEAAAAAGNVKPAADADTAVAFVAAYLACGDLSSAVSVYGKAREAVSQWAAVSSKSSAGVKSNGLVGQSKAVADILTTVADGAFPACRGATAPGLALEEGAVAAVKDTVTATAVADARAMLALPAPLSSKGAIPKLEAKLSAAVAKLA